MAAMQRAATLAALTLVLLSPAAAQRRPEWPDTFQSRVEAVALLQSLNAEILASSSATRTLEAWCGEHHMAAEPAIVATRVTGVRKEPAADQLERLGVHDGSEVLYRRVELRCGAHVLSEADNWYVPARLTAEMNALLETTNTPFGKVVQPLHPYRRTVSMLQLWTPLPRGWEQQTPAHIASHPRQRLAVPREVFQHRAVLYSADHLPISEVVETYQGELLAFAREGGAQ